MNAEELRATQTPLKTRYREAPEAARLTLRATGRITPTEQSCAIETGAGPVVVAGLHPFAGGDGSAACAGDLFLQALAACAGVTLAVVATALGIPIRSGTVTAEGDLDFRGTLGVSRETPVGFTAIRLHFDLDGDADAERLANLLKLTERYCVNLQTLKTPPEISSTIQITGTSASS
ncbi:MAG: OsmC family protein [Isosphaeraceae bacterium]